MIKALLHTKQNKVGLSAYYDKRYVLTERKCAADILYVEDSRKFQIESVTAMLDAPAWVTFSQFLISFLSLFWYPAPNELHYC